MGRTESHNHDGRRCIPNKGRNEMVPPPPNCVLFDPMSEIHCTTCGVTIQPITAARNNGQCVPCNNGTRADIDAALIRNREERERDKTDAARIYWRELVARVYKADDGFEHLSEPEKKYYAVSCLNGDTYNGGLEQFFSHAGASHYRYALAGLVEMGAYRSIELLTAAKHLLFGEAALPEDLQTRYKIMVEGTSASRDTLLDQLDRL